MKYSAKNKPVECMQTQSRCYKLTSNKSMRPLGVLIHSTGANNPTLKRYVQPSADAKDRDKMLALLGKNNNGNDWNRDGMTVNGKYQKLSAGLNGWIGKAADGTVMAVQAMPWTFAPWGCGSGPRGSCNAGWIQFEICEDGLTDKAYFTKVYQEAVELVAYLCQLYGLDPNGTTTYNGVKVPVILDHKTSHALGLGSNHGDVGHWFPRHGKSLATFRRDVAKLLKSTTKPSDTTTSTGSASGPEYPDGAIKHSEAWALLRKHGMTEIGAAATMGNAYAESGLAANNLQNNGNKALGLSDAEFTARLNSGAYSRETFIKDGYGYGWCQWTYHTRKAAFYDHMAAAGKGFGDEVSQIEYMVKELKKSYPSVWAMLTGGAKTLREASDAFMLKYEAPADKSEKKRRERAEYAEEMLAKYGSRQTADKPVSGETKQYKVRITAAALNVRKGPGTNYGVAMTIRDKGVYTIAEEATGPGAKKWGKLLSGAGWISLDHTKKI